LKSERAIVARISIDQKATKLINKKLFHGVTISTNTPPMIPEKYPNFTGESSNSAN